MALARLRLGTLVFLVGENAEAARIMEATYFEAAQAEELEVAFMAAAQLVGVLGYQLARHDEALRWARHAELVLARMPGANDVMRAPLLVDLSTVYFAMGDYPQAQATAQRVLEVYEESLGPVHPLVADALTNLGLFHLVRGDYAEAKALLERALVIREQTHRAKNTFAILSALAQQSAHGATNVEDFRDRLTERVRALSSAYSLMSASEPDAPVELGELVRLALSPFTDAYMARLRIVGGPVVRFAPSAAIPLALCLHELATNAVKHGALSAPEGRLRLGWSVDEGIEQDRPGGFVLRREF